MNCGGWRPLKRAGLLPGLRRTPVSGILVTSVEPAPRDERAHERNHVQRLPEPAQNVQLATRADSSGVAGAVVGISWKASISRMKNRPLQTRMTM